MISPKEPRDHAASDEPSIDVPPSTSLECVCGDSLRSAKDCRQEAIRSFYKDSFPALVGYLMYCGAKVDDAADIAQETMLDLIQEWDSIIRPHAWIRKVATRKHRRRANQINESKWLAYAGPLVAPDIDILKWEERHGVLSLLQGLPQRQREVMALTVDGYRPSEIADILEIRRTAVRSSLRKARETLTDRLRSRGEAAR